MPTKKCNFAHQIPMSKGWEAASQAAPSCYLSNTDGIQTTSKRCAMAALDSRYKCCAENEMHRIISVNVMLVLKQQIARGR